MPAAHEAGTLTRAQSELLKNQRILGVWGSPHGAHKCAGLRAHSALSNNWLKASKTRDQTPWTAGLLRERSRGRSSPPESTHCFYSMVTLLKVGRKTEGGPARYMGRSPWPCIAGPLLLLERLVRQKADYILCWRMCLLPVSAACFAAPGAPDHCAARVAAVWQLVVLLLLLQIHKWQLPRAGTPLPEGAVPWCWRAGRLCTTAAAHIGHSSVPGGTGTVAAAAAGPVACVAVASAICCTACGSQMLCAQGIGARALEDDTGPQE